MKIFIFIICLGACLEQVNYAFSSDLTEREGEDDLEEVLELEEPSIPAIAHKEQGGTSKQPLGLMDEKSSSFSTKLPEFKKGLKLPSFLINTAEVEEKKLPRHRNCESLKKGQVFRAQELTDVIVKTVKNPVYNPAQGQEGLEEWEKGSKASG